MRKSVFNLLLLSLVVLGFAACSDDDDVDSRIRLYSKVDDKGRYTDEVTTWETSAMFSYSFGIKGGVPEYKVRSSDESIATATIGFFDKKYVLGVTPTGLGTAQLEVEDANGSIATLSVTVREYQQVFTVKATAVEVNVTNETEENKADVEKIKTEIAALLVGEGTVYDTRLENKETGGKLFLYTKDKPEEKTEGTFNILWDTETGKMTYVMKYNGQEFPFRIEFSYSPRTQKSVSGSDFRPSIVYMVMDMTEKYAAEYPDLDIVEAAGIQGVDFWYE